MDTNIKDITFRAKRKDNGEEVFGGCLFAVSRDDGSEKAYFMMQRGESLILPVYINEAGNAIQVTGNLYQIDFPTLQIEIEAESVDEV